MWWKFIKPVQICAFCKGEGVGELCICHYCGSRYHLFCVDNRVDMTKKFPSLRCKRCWRSIHPLTRQVEDYEVLKIPASEIIFPQRSYSQLHFQPVGETFPSLFFDIRNINDQYPRFLCIYLNNSRYDKITTWGDVYYELDPMPEGIIKFTIEIHYGGWKEHGWELLEIGVLQ